MAQNTDNLMSVKGFCKNLPFW